jgi:hypothetical protein
MVENATEIAHEDFMDYMRRGGWKTLLIIAIIIIILIYIIWM